MSAALPNATAWITVVETSQGPSRQVNWTKMRGVDHSPLFSEAQTQAYATAARSDLEAENKRLREALEKLTHYAECQVAAFSSGRPSLDMTLFPHLCANARAALKEQP